MLGPKIDGPDLAAANLDFQRLLCDQKGHADKQRGQVTC